MSFSFSLYYQDQPLVSRYKGERKRSKEDILLEEEDQVREYLSNLNTHKFHGSYWDALLSAEGMNRL